MLKPKRMLSLMLILGVLLGMATPAFATEDAQEDEQSAQQVETAMPAVPVEKTDARTVLAEEDATIGAEEEEPAPAEEEPNIEEAEAETEKTDDPIPDDAEPGIGTGVDIGAGVDYADVAGHWAEQDLRRALADGYIDAFGDKTLRPNQVFYKDQIWGVLAKILPKRAQPKDIPLGEALTRGDLCLILDEAFSLSTARERKDLSSYKDAGLLSTAELKAVSALLDMKVISGFEDGTLQLDKTLSRAEFVTFLYRLLPDGTKPIRDLSKASADRVIWYAKDGDKLYFGDEFDVNTLIVQGQGTTECIAKGDNAPSELYLVGSGRYYEVKGEFKTVHIVGDWNTVVLEDGVEAVQLDGQGNVLQGAGTVDKLTLAHKDNKVEVTANKQETLQAPKLEDAVYTLDIPLTLAPEAMLTATLNIRNDQPLPCRVSWYAGGELAKQEELTLTPEGVESQYLAQFVYTKDMPKSVEIRYTVEYTADDGEVQRLVGTPNVVELQNHPDSYYDQYSVSKVLSRVTTGYKGNYTTVWAEQNDYDDTTKEVWVNAKGYKSTSEYLIWINTTYQRVNVFTGSQGNWKLDRTFLVGTGRNGHNTPVGVYTVTYRQTDWTTSTYHVSPVVRFKQGSGLAFHSRKYNPRGTRMIDPSIGYPISLGCIRMYDEDIDWIYNVIPKGTTVVVY